MPFSFLVFFVKSFILISPRLFQYKPEIIAIFDTIKNEIKLCRQKKSSPYIIAEIGQAHEGSFGILHSYIDALAPTGVDAVKFQMHIAEAESSEHEPFRVKFSLEDKTRFDYWKRMGFSLEQWKGIKKHCDEVGLDFICSPFSNLAVDWLEEIGVEQYKIGSGEVNNFLIIGKNCPNRKASNFVFRNEFL